MIASAKNYTKKQTNKQTNKWRDRTLGQMVKTKLHRQNQTKKHTHTPSQKEKKEKKKKISLLPKSTTSIWDDLLSIQVFHRSQVHQVDC